LISCLGVRTESPAEARDLDASTRAAWVGHPKFMVIDNSTDFEGKMRKLVNATARLVGLPSTLNRITLKYLLDSEPNLDFFPDDIKYHIFDVEKVYLHENKPPPSDDGCDDRGQYEDEYSFIRKRSHVSQSGLVQGITYGLTTVRIVSGDQQIEVKRIITGREYRSAYKNRDISRRVVKQKRISFLYKMQSFSIHIYREPMDVEGLCILHAQAEGTENEHKEKVEDITVDLPEFLKVVRQLEGTKRDQKKYGAYSISLVHE